MRLVRGATVGFPPSTYVQSYPRPPGYGLHDDERKEWIAFDSIDSFEFGFARRLVGQLCSAGRGKKKKAQYTAIRYTQRRIALCKQGKKETYALSHLVDLAELEREPARVQERTEVEACRNE